MEIIGGDIWINPQGYTMEINTTTITTTTTRSNHNKF